MPVFDRQPVWPSGDLVPPAFAASLKRNHDTKVTDLRIWFPFGADTPLAGCKSIEMGDAVELLVNTSALLRPNAAGHPDDEPPPLAVAGLYLRLTPELNWLGVWKQINDLINWPGGMGRVTEGFLVALLSFDREFPNIGYRKPIERRFEAVEIRDFYRLYLTVYKAACTHTGVPYSPVDVALGGLGEWLEFQPPPSPAEHLAAIAELMAELAS